MAIKILNEKLDYSAEVMTMNEVNAMSILDHPHIIKQYESGYAPYIKP